MGIASYNPSDFPTAGAASQTVGQVHGLTQAQAEQVSSFLGTMAAQPSAYWIDVKEKIRKGSLNPRSDPPNQPFLDTETVEGILEDAT